MPSPNSLTSIIICTCNRASALRQTLQALEKLQFLPGRLVELVVVDNASSDDTASIVKNFAPKNIPTRYLHEGKKGLSNARNAGLAFARGEFILFTDDDVFPATDWAEQMLAPLESGKCDAVTGRVSLAQHIQRPWLTSMHKAWIASNEDIDLLSQSHELIGACMGFRRRVLDQVPSFDSELGAGALGVAEESLFAWQLIEGGFKVQNAPLAGVIHAPDPSRLLHSAWLADAKRRGQSEAYLRRHWKHTDIAFPRTKFIWYAAKLWLRSKFQRQPPFETEGCAPWEMSYLFNKEMCRHFLVERQRPRNYSRRGLKKANP